MDKEKDAKKLAAEELENRAAPFAGDPLYKDSDPLAEPTGTGGTGGETTEEPPTRPRPPDKKDPIL